MITCPRCHGGMLRDWNDLFCIACSYRIPLKGNLDRDNNGEPMMARCDGGIIARAYGVSYRQRAWRAH